MTSLPFLLIRLAIGFSLLGHGLVRLPKLTTFSNWMVGIFDKSILPSAIVLPFSYVLPIAEFVLGLMLVLGLLTKQALVASAILMIILILGTCLIENWEALPSQLIHVMIIALLLQFISANQYSIDNLLVK
ncbi:MauE/DoxX family redox-associated membrane protein [Flectobacillus major]|uniref:MauE/DoxX family redox-associated membrane protein n=1 Tax=Flectobacillus major TaxID=103 RepID=UPI0003FD2DDB|nr:MauE/DoxX family redox-associated membrane protein [Flectobacillus major]